MTQDHTNSPKELYLFLLEKWEGHIAEKILDGGILRDILEEYLEGGVLSGDDSVVSDQDKTAFFVSGAE